MSWSDDREWLVTNGLGGYASSTITGINTRKYHGLLIAAFSSEDRRLLVPKIEEEISLDGKTYTLSGNQYWGDTKPESQLYLDGFSLSPGPTFRYKLPGAVLEKSVSMAHGMNATIVGYKIESESGKAGFAANIMTTSRSHHEVLRDQSWHFGFDMNGGVALMVPTHENPPTICAAATKGVFQKPPYDNAVVKGLFYKKESERGYMCLEDVFIGARMEAELGGKDEFFIILSADTSTSEALKKCKSVLKSPKYFIKGARDKRAGLKEHFYKKSKAKKSEALDRLVESSDDFIVDKEDMTSIIAGYPWFGEWGRDSLVSLPGLCLCTGRKGKAESVMVNLLKRAEGGLIPNNFIDGKNLNSLDTSLLFFWAVWKYMESVKDYDFIREHLWPGMKGIVDAYKEFMDGDGLIEKESELPMTWMDAVTTYGPATLRSGKAVEIQALWFNALSICSKLAKRFKEKEGEYDALLSAARKSFNELFWNKEASYTFDVVQGEYKDPSIRPNAIFSVSLPFPILEKKRWSDVVKRAEEELLTPFGLRSLSAKDEKYRGQIRGDQIQRDLSYHQGTVWPWLLGPFADAYRRAYPKKGIANLIKPLLEKHLWESCVGCVNEVFDGDEPHRPSGCLHQAWSVGELLRVLCEGD